MSSCSNLKTSLNSVETWFGVISFANIILYIIPLMLEKEPFGYSSDTSLPIYASLQSIEFRYTLIISLSISIPLSLEILLRILLLQKKEKIPQNLVSNVVTLSFLAVPDLVILFYMIPNSKITAIHYVIRSRISFLLWTVFLFIHRYSGKYWSRFGWMILIISMTISRVAVFYSDYSSGTNKDFIIIIVICFQIISFLTFAIMSVKWFIFLFDFSKKAPVSTDQYLCCVYASAMLICWLGVIIGVSFNPNFPLWYKWDSNLLVLHTLMFTVFYVVVTLFEGRAFMRETLQNKVRTVA